MFCVEFGVNTDLSFAPTEIVTFHLEKKKSSRDDDSISEVNLKFDTDTSINEV